MVLSQVKEILNAQVIAGEQFIGCEVCTACGSDLMSDVLAFVKEQGILLTGLVNAQVVRTAEMMDIKVIVFVRGKVPNDEMVRMAIQKEMVLMSTGFPMYIACGKLYNAGLIPGE